jgi:hypothetical protein
VKSRRNWQVLPLAREKWATLRNFSWARAQDLIANMCAAMGNLDEDSWEKHQRNTNFMMLAYDAHTSVRVLLKT